MGSDTAFSKFWFQFQLLSLQEINFDVLAFWRITGQRG